MAENDETDFNPYTEWLSIPVQDQPPSLYQLIGVVNFETDEQRIDEASSARAAELHQLAAGPQRELVQKLLSDVAKARRTLLNNDARAAYDEALRNPKPNPSERVAATPKSAAGFPGIQTGSNATSKGQTDDLQKQNKSPANRRPPAKQTNWTPHAISAGLLLAVVSTVVGVSFLRGGSRSASDTMDVADSSSFSESSARAPDSQSIGAAFDPKPGTGERAASTRMDLSTMVPTAQATAKTAPAEPTPKPSPTSGPKSVPAKSVKLPSPWGKSLAVAENFDEIGVARFGGSLEAFKADKGKLMILAAAKGSRFAQLRCKSTQVAMGEAVSIDLNLCSSTDLQTRVGLGIGQAKIAVQVTRANFRIDRIEQQPTILKSMPFDKSLAAGLASLRLTVIRDAMEAKRVWWVVQRFDANGVVKTDSITGSFNSEIAPGPVNVTLLFSRPKRRNRTQAWVTNLRTGELTPFTK